MLQQSGPRCVNAVAALFLLLVMSSCKDTRQLTYFERGLDTSSIKNFKIPEPVIQRGDLLNITVYSDNPEATKIYNQPVSTGSADKGQASSAPAGYEVDANGYILFQGIGPLHIEGLNKKELTDLLTSRLKDTLLKKPYFSIRFMNMKVSILGEVRNPGSISIPNERLNILEALSLAGDFTDYARRDSVIIIRESLNERKMIGLDLSKTDVLRSPDYFLQHNDVIVVKAIQQKYKATDEVRQRNISIGLSMISVAAVLINTIAILTRN